MLLTALALVFSTAALTLVLHDKYLKRQEAKNDPINTFREWSPNIPAGPAETVAPFEKDPTKSMAAPMGMSVDDHFNEAFESSDDGFTGINEDFGV